MNRRTTIILLAVFVVLGGIAYYLNANPEAAGRTPTPTLGAPPKVWQLESNNIKSVTVIDRVRNVTFSAAVDEQEAWTITQPSPGPADGLTMSSVSSTLGALYINRTITETVDLAEFGLITPDYTIEVVRKDGATLKADVGKKAVTGAAYYVLPAGAVNAVLVSSSTLDSLLTLPSQPPFATPTPEVTPTATLVSLPFIGTPASP